MIIVDSHCIKFSVENDDIEVIKYETKEERIYTFDVKITQNGSINHFEIKDIFCMKPYLILSDLDGNVIKHYENLNDELSKFINSFSD